MPRQGWWPALSSNYILSFTVQKTRQRPDQKNQNRICVRLSNPFCTMPNADSAAAHHWKVRVLARQRTSSEVTENLTRARARAVCACGFAFAVADSALPSSSIATPNSKIQQQSSSPLFGGPSPLSHREAPSPVPPLLPISTTRPLRQRAIKLWVITTLPIPRSMSDGAVYE